MRILPMLSKLSMLSLCLLPAASLAQDQPKLSDLTASAPKTTKLLVRLPSPDRIDALAKEFVPQLGSLLPKEIAGLLEKGGGSTMLMGQIKLGGQEIDRSKPIYLAATWGGAVTIASTAAGGLYRAGSEGDIDAPQRGTPTSMLAGDLALHLYVADLTDQFRPQIVGGLQMIPGLVGRVPMVPDSITRPLPALLGIVQGGLFGIQSLDYALSLKGSVIESEGRLVTREGSSMRKLFARAGTPGANSLAGFLPADAFMIADAVANPDWPGKEFEAYFDAALGEGAARAFSNIMTPDPTLWGVTSGRSATAISIGNIMAGATTLRIFELKQGTDPKTVIDKFDVAGLNAAMKAAQVPTTYKVVKDAAKHGETALHRIEIGSEDPMFAMAFAMQQTYVAAEGRYLFVASGANAEADLTKLLDRVREGEPDAAHPHLKAMASLGRERNGGVSINFGVLKSLAPMLVMILPDAAQALGQMPDRLYMSTALSFENGNLHWRGDWPLKEMAAMAGALKALQQGPQPGGKKKAPDEDFD